MDGGGPWRVLRLKNHLPHLLVKDRFDRDGYEVQITDLCRVWGETLRKRAIIERAARDNECSIDIGEDGQYEILLDKIASALRSDSGTTLDLRRSQTANDLELHIAAPLPAPLPTFLWICHVSELPQKAMAVELITPLLLQANDLHNRIDSLRSEISVRDSVISKITDKLENTGYNLADVFPGASNIRINRKKSQRDQLASHVRGLGEFSYDAWQASLVRDHATRELDFENLVSALKNLPHTSVRTGSDWTGWWEDLTLSGDEKTREIDQGAGDRERNENGPKSTSRGEISEDDFHRQPTPTLDDVETDVEGSPKPTGRTEHKEDSTEDETDLDAPLSLASSRTKGRSQPTEGSTALSDDVTCDRARPEAPANRRKKTSEPNSLHDGQTKQRPQSSVLGGEPGSQGSDNGDNLQSEDTAAPRLPRKLGVFGGRSKVAPGMPEPDVSETRSPKPKSKIGLFGGSSKAPPTGAIMSTDKFEESQRSGRKLGVFGGKGIDQITAVMGAESGGYGRASLINGTKHPGTVSSPSTVGETKKGAVMNETEEAEEGADEKRQRLKRELEEKSKAPVKKKRKF